MIGRVASNAILMQKGPTLKNIKSMTDSINKFFFKFSPTTFWTDRVRIGRSTEFNEIVERAIREERN